jgi:ribosome-interacting GTPase 1
MNISKTKNHHQRKTPTVCRIYARITPTEADKLNSLVITHNTTISDLIRQLIRNT